MTNRDIVKHLINFREMKIKEKESGVAKFSIRIGFIIQKNIQILEKAYEPYLASLNELKRKHNIQEDTSAENYPSEFYQDVEELLDIDNKEVNLEVFSYSDLEKCKGLTLEDQEILFFLVQE